ncbi:sugar phosphate isomerase/epimerase [Aerococcus agrisoli]|uniref:Sugar phosphate isomerase/epimerase n=1 Tax=Aerococcus agrisoli TaxID=2487350 RepID=A0A3N4GSF3_9LACT|nr:TIM barrel protein [Aerococcus agrisoli]RPA63616.1 sugar phosphate isomerase/epimerase [Aerococcus agrisoli]
MNWVLNTIAYGDLVKNDNFGQLDMLQSIHETGFQTVELRSEYFDGSEEELRDLKTTSRDLGLKVFLSIPAPLFEAGKLNAKLDEFLALAQAVGAVQLKINLGRYDPATVADDMVVVNDKIATTGVVIVLENDNTPEMGSSDYFKGFLETYGNDQVGMCFDVGNFLFFQEDPVEAVKNVLPYIHYMHLKQVEEATQASLAGLSVGDVDITSILKLVDPAIPVAVECQYLASDVDEVAEQVKTDLSNTEASLD